ncbi:uncharacterized protein LOC113870313 [Abrus precatorius]|uniref:Uncharacterized protein LOC113870313 n=1 Tax=Abrus precatorius TaxID=3816 RepID=A0A8B8M419_ABRPR|nr:uncharacterized protein LOC113870313 [Abrus precatorius]
MAIEVHYHVRSISLPSRLHPSLPKIEKELKRLKTWDASSQSQASTDTTSSLQTVAIKASLAGLVELYNCVHELIGSPQTQQALRRHEGKHVEKPLDMSIGLLDICGSTRELLLLMKEHVLDLQSTLRRKGLDSSINSQICAYICFRKKARKDISKKLKALKTMEKNNSKSYPPLDVDHHLLMVINVLSELSTITISFFRKLLLFMCAPVFKKNTSGWSLFSKMVSTESDKETRIINEMGDVHVILCSFHKRFRKNEAKFDVQIVKRRLGELEVNIRELEVGLDYLFRCLIQQRVSLLNLLTP